MKMWHKPKIFKQKDQWFLVFNNELRYCISWTDAIIICTNAYFQLYGPYDYQFASYYHSKDCNPANHPIN